jgi:hypothetical protein
MVQTYRRPVLLSADSGTWTPPIAGAPNGARDIEACDAAQAAVGPDVPLMLDGHHSCSRSDALTIGYITMPDEPGFGQPLDLDYLAAETCESC